MEPTSNNFVKIHSQIQFTPLSQGDVWYPLDTAWFHQWTAWYSNSVSDQAGETKQTSSAAAPALKPGPVCSVPLRLFFSSSPQAISSSSTASSSSSSSSCSSTSTTSTTQPGTFTPVHRRVFALLVRWFGEKTQYHSKGIVVSNFNLNSSEKNLRIVW